MPAHVDTPESVEDIARRIASENDYYGALDHAAAALRRYAALLAAPSPAVETVQARLRRMAEINREIAGEIIGEDGASCHRHIAQLFEDEAAALGNLPEVRP